MVWVKAIRWPRRNFFQPKEGDGLVSKEKSRLVNSGLVVGRGPRYLESMKG